MELAVLDSCVQANALIMAAAVADYRPTHQKIHKIKKNNENLIIELEPTSDILASINQKRQDFQHPLVVVGFAAETENLINNARSKLERKNLDIIVANDVSAPDAGFSVDTNRVTLIYADGAVEDLPLMSKIEVAQVILEKLISSIEDKL
jgi:phosphopantothenoylcysteine decarboxylase/phosphopantothenate--cysteine ligase